VKTLAEAVVSLMEELVRAEEPGIDLQRCGEIENEMWFELAKASPDERKALADAAANRLAEWLAEPDEHGFTPRALVTPQHREFLQSIADGSAWHEFDFPEAEDD